MFGQLDILAKTISGYSLSDLGRAAMAQLILEAGRKVGGNTTASQDLATALLREDYRVLAVQPDCDDDFLKAVYKWRAKRCHPDTGGSAEEFKVLDAAYSRICQHRGIKK
jgi:hypothetical protein